MRFVCLKLGNDESHQRKYGLYVFKAMYYWMVESLSFFAFDASEYRSYGTTIVISDGKTFKLNTAIVKPSEGFD